MGVKVIDSQVAKARKIIMDSVPLSKFLTDMGLNDGKSLAPIDKVRCPVHDDSSPSFHFDDDKQVCKCFGCDLKGGVVEVHYALNLEKNPSHKLYKSVQMLAKHYHVSIPDLFEYTLENNTSLRDKSKRKRGISDEEAKWFFKEKLMKLEGRYNHLPIKQRIQISIAIDNVWLGQRDAKEIYKAVTKIISEENRKIMEAEMNGEV